MAACSWNNLLSTLGNAGNKKLLPMINNIINHNMYEWVKVPALYHYLYHPDTKNQELIYQHKEITLNRILSMLNSMEKGI